MRSRIRRAFTLVEILIVVVILGILAAIVVPQFTNASEDAQAGNVVSQLQTIRNAIELFKARNASTNPDMSNWTQLVNEQYLKKAPVNPRTNSSLIGPADDPTLGWLWADPDGNGVNDIYAAYFDEALYSDGDPNTSPWIGP